MSWYPSILLLAASIVTHAAGKPAPVAFPRSAACFTIAAHLHCLELANGAFVLKRWSPETSAFTPWAASGAESVSGEIAGVSIFGPRRISVQLVSDEGAVELWDIAIEAETLRPVRAWRGTPERSHPFGAYRVGGQVVTTDGDSLTVLTKDSVVAVDRDVSLTDLSVSSLRIAAATGHGIRTWNVSPRGLEAGLGRDYNANVGQVAAVDDGWAFLALQGEAVKAIVVDGKLMPVYAIPLPGHVAWELHQVGNAVAVAGSGTGQGWVIARKGAERIVWEKPLAGGAVAAADSPDVLWLTDGETAVQPSQRVPESIDGAAGMRLGSRVFITTPTRRLAIYSLTAFMVLVVGAAVLTTLGRA